MDATTDPLRALEVGARSGYAAADVDDFVARMDMAMEEIKNGTFDPATCKIPGYKTLEQEEADRLQQLQREEERRRREEERKRALKHEEREHWWMKAKLRFSVDDDTDDKCGDNQKEGTSAAKARFAASRALAAYKERDANDYSIWSKWEPRDPVTLEENAEHEAQQEKKRNQEFEANNPEFCSQFKEDLAKRQKSQREKERLAEKHKQQGNACYKKKRYESAIEHYMKALGTSPFHVAVLTNIAQSFLRLEQLEDSIEFSTRALFINPEHVKALSRRAAALHCQRQWKDAAADMESALVLEPDNQDLVEQHSVIVGDYEDSLAQSELHAALASKSALRESEHVETEELRFASELLKRMDEPTPVANDNQEQENALEDQHGAQDGGMKCLAKIDWIAYDLLLPLLQRNESVRTLIRTSGELMKLCDRLAVMMESPSFAAILHDNMDQQLIVNTMFNCAAAAMERCSRNQVVMYRNAQFRKRMLAVLEEIGLHESPKMAASGAGTVLPWSTQAGILCCIDEAVDLKSWKRAVASSKAALRTLLALIQLPPAAPPSALPIPEHQSMQRAILAASGICFSINGDDHGMREFVQDPADTLQAIAIGLSHWERLDTRTVSNLLGLLTNLSSVEAFRDALEIPGMRGDHSLAQGLAHALMGIAKHNMSNDSDDVSTTERALAALLNLSFHPTSRIRHNLVAADAVTSLETVLGAMTPLNCSKLLLVLSRAVSVLCRLHSVLPATANQLDSTSNNETDSAQDAKATAQITHRHLLELLYQTSLQVLSAKPSKSTTASDSIASEAWQLCAQIWCHIGWCVGQPSVRAYLREKSALRTMFQAVALANGHGGASYHDEDANARERLVGNIVKVLIVMQADRDVHDAQVLAKKANLATLVEALRRLPDGLARKNVAILLAKLCQSDPSVKDEVRELRGIEMMLTVSQSLKQQQQKTPSK